MTRREILPVALWIAFLASCAVVVARAAFTADLSAFLPKATTAEQRVLVEQLTEGAVSRLILVGIDAGDPAVAARLSKAIARPLRTAPEFAQVGNGEAVDGDRDRAFLMRNRYLLSPAVSAERFSADGLSAAIAESVERLASPAGLVLKSMLARDPTGELLRLLDPGMVAGAPAMREGVWMSRDGRRAVLVARTQAKGSDIDGQMRAQAAIRGAFDEAVAAAGASDARLLLSGPGVFAVASRETIKRDVTRLSAAGLAGIVVLLLAAYRSLPALALGLVPVLTGALCGVAAVALGFGVVHGITLGFGTTLIGEAVDYSIYLFVQSSRAAEGEPRDSSTWIAAYWPTVRLGMLTSVCGFAMLLFSSFPGLAQLGLYSVCGLVAAAAVTRFVLPALLPAGFRVRDLAPLGRALAAVTAVGPAVRWALIALFVAAVAIVGAHAPTLWNPNLAALSPVSAADQALDLALRADLGAPDVRFLVVVPAADRDGALRAAERAGGALDGLVEAGMLGGYSTPAQFLPSRATQQERRAALPPPAELEARLRAATAEGPLRYERLAPFRADVDAARQASPLTRSDLDGTSFALLADALMIEHDGHWSAVLPLRAARPSGADSTLDAPAVRAALARSGVPGALLVDMKGETDRMYGDYLTEAIRLALAGLGVMIVLLLFVLRSPARVLRVLAPLVGAAAVVVAAHVVAGRQLNLLHLVGIMLVFAVGSNYALFFDRRAFGGDADGTRTLASLLLASATTLIGFGVLAFSQVPILQAIGATVGPGAALALLFSAALADNPEKHSPVRTDRWK